MDSSLLSWSSWYEETAAPTGRQRDSETVGFTSAPTAFWFDRFGMWNNYTGWKYTWSYILQAMHAHKVYYLRIFSAFLM